MMKRMVAKPSKWVKNALEIGLKMSKESIEKCLRKKSHW